MRRVLIVVLVAAACVFAQSAAAATKTLYHVDSLDAIASEVAGVPVIVVSSDNYAEWDIMARRTGIDGWTCIACGEPSWLYDPLDGRYYDVYRTIWIHPDLWTAFRDIATNGFRPTMDIAKAGEAMLTLDHEGQHWRLFSHDEARVNACALADLPRFLQVDWRLPATVQQTVTDTQQYRVKVRKRVRVHGKLVWRYRYVTRTRLVTSTIDVPNPVYVGILAAAAQVRANQPPPYNTGVC